MRSQFRALVLQGPRQSGKTTLAKWLQGDAQTYRSLENPDYRQLALEDPRSFLDSFGPAGGIIDEVQRAPQILSYLQEVLDDNPARGQFILTGSNNLLLMEQVTQSLAGRAGYAEILPFSLAEMQRAQPQISLAGVILNGQYPESATGLTDPQSWQKAYLRTYIERDVRQLKNISDLLLFQRFMQLCAARIGQQVNYSALGIACGLDSKTMQSWMGILEASYIIKLLPPYYENFNKRIVKTPKLYFLDTGLAAQLLGVREPETFDLHPAKGPLFENWVFTELLKAQANTGAREQLYYWRDSSGNEVDFLLDRGDAGRTAIEVKSGATWQKGHHKALKFWKELAPQDARVLVYAGKDNFRFEEDRVLNWQSLAEI